jgi:hypothetical protein
MAEQIEQGGAESSAAYGRRSGDGGVWSMLFRNGRRGAAVFWILLWFTVAIVTALSSLVSTQFKETFRTSGIPLSQLVAETHRLSEEKKVVERLQKLSNDMDLARVSREQAVREHEEAAFIFKRQDEDLSRLLEIDPEKRTDAQNGRIETLRKEIAEKRPLILKLQAAAYSAEGSYVFLQNEYKALVDKSAKDLAPPQNPEVTTFARDSLYLQNDFFLMRWFFEMPSDLVTLWLALCMGALGSVIYVLREVFDDKAVVRPTSWFFMRPFLGMVLAFVMYLLIRTGQTTFTDPAGGPSSLNPFTISFLAVISGLMSDRAYSRIVSAAENLLGPDGGTPAKPESDVDDGDNADGDGSPLPPPPPPPPPPPARPVRRRQK